MKEAFGGIFNIFFIVIFLVVMIGLLGIVVSYAKAFRMKDAIISVIEEYEGSGCDPERSIEITSSNTPCRNEIINKARELGYSPPSLNCSEMSSSGVALYNAEGYYCYGVIKKGDDRIVYRIVTQVDIDLPVIHDIMGFHFFQVVGDTELIILPPES